MPFFFMTLRTSMTPVQAAAAIDGVSREKRSLSEFFETMGQPDANQFIARSIRQGSSSLVSSDTRTRSCP